MPILSVALYRAAPEIVTLYAANLPATAIRAKIRQQFEKNKYVDDLEAVDILLLKGYQEFQETINAWKMDSHLMRMFNDEEVRSRESLSYMYANHLSLAVSRTAWYVEHSLYDRASF